MRIIITGTNYKNKGAQSMLFTAVNEMRKNFPACEIFFTTSETIDCSEIKMQTIFYTAEIQKLLLKELGMIRFAKKSIKQAAKFVLGRSKKFWYKGYADSLKKILSSADMIIDASGFALGDKWTASGIESYLDHIRLAKKFNIPIYIMPQSFGPFDFSDWDENEKNRLMDKIKETLQYPRIIFPREREGYEMLQEFGFKNLMLSTDTVLQSKGVDPENIFTSGYEMNIPEMLTENNVAVIPNSQCFRRVDKETILSMYDSLIRILLEADKTVYVFRHSGEDLDICKQIKARFADENSVILWENDFSCFEYDTLVKNFDFIICSRYHGIVHAFRNGVPAIALGWAIKYKELLHNVGQDRYEFDITSEDFDVHAVEAMLREMLARYEQESECIKAKVEKIQSENCYDAVVKDFSALTKNKSK